MKWKFYRNTLNHNHKVPTQHSFTVNNIDSIISLELYLEPFDKVINEKFLPALFGTPISPIDR